MNRRTMLSATSPFLAVAAMLMLPVASSATRLPGLLTNQLIRPRFQVRPAVISYTGEGTGDVGGSDGTGRHHSGHYEYSVVHQVSDACLRRRRARPVYLPSECTNQVQRPSFIRIACGDGSTGMEKLVWHAWVAPSPRGWASRMSMTANQAVRSEAFTTPLPRYTSARFASAGVGASTHMRRSLWRKAKPSAWRGDGRTYLAVPALERVQSGP